MALIKNYADLQTHATQPPLKKLKLWHVATEEKNKMKFKVVPEGDFCYDDNGKSIPKEKGTWNDALIFDNEQQAQQVADALNAIAKLFTYQE